MWNHSLSLSENFNVGGKHRTEDVSISISDVAARPDVSDATFPGRCSENAQQSGCGYSNREREALLRDYRNNDESNSGSGT